MPGSGNKGDRGSGMGGGVGGGNAAGAGAGGGDGGSKGNYGGGMSAASHKGDTVSGAGHSAYGPRNVALGYANVTGQERMARIGDRLASASMSGFSNGTSSGAAPTGIGGGFGPGQGPAGARAAQVGRDAFAAAQRAASFGGLGFGRPSAPRPAARPPSVVAPKIVARPPAVPPNIAQYAFAPTIARLQAPTTALTSPNVAMNPGVVGVMAASQVPGYSAPAPSAPALANPNVGYADPGMVSRPATARMGGYSPTRAPATPGLNSVSMMGGLAHQAAERGPTGFGTGYGLSQKGDFAGNTTSMGKNATGPSAVGTGTGGMPGGVPAGHRKDNTQAGYGTRANTGVKTSVGMRDSPLPGAVGPGALANQNAGYADAGQRFGGNTALAGMAAANRPGDPGVRGLPGGLAGRGQTQAQALARSAMESGWGQASPTQAANLMARAVKGELGPAATAALAAAQSSGFSPGAMMAAVAALSPKANLSFNHPQQAAGLVPGVQEKMNQLAKILGVNDFQIVSGYRDPAYNQKVRGARKSQHMKGTAVDVAYPANVKTEADRENFARAMSKAGFTGIGIYGGWAHGDLGPTRGWGDTSGRDAVAKGIAGGK